jgi:hypothetical protein
MRLPMLHTCSSLDQEDASVTRQHEMLWVTATNSTILLLGVNLYKLLEQISAVAENGISCLKAKICNKILHEAMKKQ